jgi:hypothetical protein
MPERRLARRREETALSSRTVMMRGRRAVAGGERHGPVRAFVETFDPRVRCASMASRSTAPRIVRRNAPIGVAAIYRIEIEVPVTAADGPPAIIHRLGSHDGMTMKRILATLIVLLLPLAAHAAEDGTLSLSPAVIMLRGDHGQSTTQTLTFRNGTSRAFSFDLVAQDVVVRNGRREVADAGSIAGSIAATAVFSQKHVEIGPGESVPVSVTVTLPPGTAQRAIVALFRGSNTVMSGNVPMTASLGTLLTFTVSDEIRLDAAKLDVRPQNASTNLGVSGTCTNTGREPLVREACSRCSTAAALVGKSELRPHRLMPGESVQIDGEYAGELEPGRYRLFVTYDYDGRSLSRSAEVVIR